MQRTAKRLTARAMAAAAKRARRYEVGQLPLPDPTPGPARRGPFSANPGQRTHRGRRDNYESAGPSQ